MTNHIKVKKNKARVVPESGIVFTKKSNKNEGRRMSKTVNKG